MHWKLFPKKSGDIIDQILINRKISLDDKDQFLNPKLTDLNNPWLLPDIDKVVKYLIRAQKEQLKVGIYGDYDADGIPGAVLLKEICDQLKLETEVHIPSRSEGYGLNIEAINHLIKQGIKILISVDLGMTNIKEIAYARDKGLIVLVLDHHEPKQELPNAQALVNAKRKDSKYPDHEISGAVVAFKLAQALEQKDLLDKKFLRWSLDLIAISVITDIVPLNKENRILAYYGLMVLKQTKRLGLKELYQVAGIKQKMISPYIVGFQIGPRINAAGRMKNASQAYYLLATKDKDQAKKLAMELNQLNQNRQDELERIHKIASAKVIKLGLNKKKLIMVEGRNWPSGLIGLVASRLVEEFFRPVVVLSRGKQMSQGSARTIPGFNILQALDRSSKWLKRYGGHEKAAGLALKNEHLASLYNSLLKIAEEELTAEDLIPEILIDAELDFKLINKKLFQQLSKLEPHGMANPRPVFYSKKVKVINMSLVGKGKEHLKMELEQDGKRFSVIGFDLGLRAKNIKINDKISIAYSIVENDYSFIPKLELNIKDIKLNNG